MTVSASSAELTPLEYLAAADKEWATGHHQEAAALLWKATKSTFIGLARERGLEYDEGLIDLAKALEGEGKVAKFYYRGVLVTGELLRDHSEMDALSGCELESAVADAREFVLGRYGKND